MPNKTKLQVLTEDDINFVEKNLNNIFPKAKKKKHKKYNFKHAEQKVTIHNHLLQYCMVMFEIQF